MYGSRREIPKGAYLFQLEYIYYKSIRQLFSLFTRVSIGSFNINKTYSFHSTFYISLMYILGFWYDTAMGIVLNSSGCIAPVRNEATGNLRVYTKILFYYPQFKVKNYFKPSILGRICWVIPGFYRRRGFLLHIEK